MFLRLEVRYFLRARLRRGTRERDLTPDDAVTLAQVAEFSRYNFWSFSEIFGAERCSAARAISPVFEKQMRGLPHPLIVFKIDGHGPIQADEIDSVIREEIPSEEEAGARGRCEGELHEVLPQAVMPKKSVDERGFAQVRRDYGNTGQITSHNKSVTVHDERHQILGGYPTTSLVYNPSRDLKTVYVRLKLVHHHLLEHKQYSKSDLQSLGVRGPLGCRLTLVDCGLPDVQDDTTEVGKGNVGLELEKKLLVDQRRILHTFVLFNNPGEQRYWTVISLDGPEDIEKFSLDHVIPAQVALAVTSSVIAAGNMPGEPQHRACSSKISATALRAELTRAKRLIVFDEAPMAHRYIFEILDQKLSVFWRLPAQPNSFKCTNGSCRGVRCSSSLPSPGSLGSFSISSGPSREMTVQYRCSLGLSKSDRTCAECVSGLLRVFFPALVQHFLFPLPSCHPARRGDHNPLNMTKLVTAIGYLTTTKYVSNYDTRREALLHLQSPELSRRVGDLVPIIVGCLRRATDRSLLNSVLSSSFWSFIKTYVFIERGLIRYACKGFINLINLELTLVIVEVQSSGQKQTCCITLLAKFLQSGPSQEVGVIVCLTRTVDNVLEHLTSTGFFFRTDYRVDVVCLYWTVSVNQYGSIAISPGTIEEDDSRLSQFIGVVD
ncbi:hypothetical protein J6590_090983 [Homalodisca vitripennis]|nr:hypothetical protein J6590_090983 [Homalodisca vitripennis]